MDALSAEKSRLLVKCEELETSVSRVSRDRTQLSFCCLLRAHIVSHILLVSSEERARHVAELDVLRSFESRAQDTMSTQKQEIAALLSEKSDLLHRVSVMEQELTELANVSSIQSLSLSSVV